MVPHFFKCPRRHQAIQRWQPLSLLVRIERPAVGPCALRVVPKRALQRIQGWGRRSAFGPNKGKAFRSCSCSWPRCHSTKKK
jgi:hypothetical protein